MNTRCDVAVIGAGPSGSYTAYRLAKAGFQVQLLEEHPIVGEPRHCTGVLGREAFDRFEELPKGPVQSELKAVWIVSPGGERFRSAWFNGQAFVIQRTLFDQALAQMALKEGAQLRTRCLVKRLRRDSGGAFLEIDGPRGRSETLQARVVVIAAGVSYRLHRQIGLAPPAVHLYSAQLEVYFVNLKEAEVYLGLHVAPGSFAWAVPLGNGKARLGVTAHRQAAHHLEALLASPLLQGRVQRNGEMIVKRPIPIRPIASSVDDHVVLVGDAAGQVKPTTGGGIYYGLIGAAEAADTLQKAFAVQRFDRTFLMAYDHNWKRALSREMFLGRLSRRVFESLQDKELDRLVGACRHPKIAALIHRSANFDWHAKNVLSFLMSPRVLSHLF